MKKTYTLELNATLTIEDNIIVFTQGKSGFYYVIILGAIIAGSVFSYQVLQFDMPYLLAIPALAILVVILMTILSKRVTLDKGRSALTVEWLLFQKHKLFGSTYAFEFKNIHLLHEVDVRRNSNGDYNQHNYYYLMNGKKKLCSVGTENTAKELSRHLGLQMAHKV